MAPGTCVRSDRGTLRPGLMGSRRGVEACSPQALLLGLAGEAQCPGGSDSRTAFAFKAPARERAASAAGEHWAWNAAASRLRSEPER